AFLAGKAASCAAAALVFATYVAPSAVRPLALAALAGMVALNLAGVRWTVRGTWLLVGVVLAVLAVAVVVVLAGSGTAAPPAGRRPRAPAAGPAGPGPGLRGGGPRFFAFAGCAR